MQWELLLHAVLLVDYLNCLQALLHKMCFGPLSKELWSYSSLGKGITPVCTRAN
jgi:hypothetical protein